MTLRYIAPVCVGCLALVLVALVFTLPAPPLRAEQAKVTSVTLVKNVRLVQDSGELGSPVSILVENGIIQSVGEPQSVAADTVIYGAGLTALPGLIDSHTHAYGSTLEDALRFGVTTLLDMFTEPNRLGVTIAARNDTSATSKADLFSAGMLATAPGGHGTQFGVRVEPLRSASEVPVWVQKRKAEGSDYIKLVYMPEHPGLPSIDRRTAKAVIDAGHAEGLMVVAHIATHKAAAAMVADGIDGLVHVFADRLIDSTLLQSAKANNIFVVPTLSVIAAVDGDTGFATLANTYVEQLSPMQKQTSQWEFDGSAHGFSLDIALKNVAALNKAGVPILAGSDAPNPGTAHGLSLHHELQLLVRAGLTAKEALAATSTVPARIFGLAGRGEIKPAARADLLLISGNPLEDIGATLNIRHIIKNGRIVE